MIRFQNVLVYCDGRRDSVEALGIGVELMRATGARLTVMDVLEDIALPERSGLDFTQMAARARADRAAELHRTVASLLAPGGLEIVVEVGTPSIQLVSRVLSHHHDLLLKTARGIDRRRHSFFSGTAWSLIRTCPCPVWLVAPEALPDRPRILAAVDPLSESGGAEFAARVLDHARALARRLDGELDVVHAWRPTAAGLLRRYATEPLLEQYITETQQRAESAVQQLVASPSLELRTHLIEGDASEVIPEFARRHRTDVIVMGLAGRSGLSRLLIGEMAEQILVEVECGVFCLKPEGFVSPVRLDAP